MATLTAEIPEKLQFLFVPYRYKIARGGRGSGKSWSFARALLIQGVVEPLRILCTREVQLSIKDSVHKLLSDQVKLLGLEGFYVVQEQTIKGRNGTEFIFSGLSTQTVDSIKSFEGLDRVWCEEGQSICKRSWDVLLPTVRKEGSEVWVSYNPDLETDETHQRFTIHPPENCVNVEVNWQDNPWFSKELDAERRHCAERDPDNYDNIWEGKCRPAVEGAIYFKEIQRAQANGQITFVPYDPLRKVQIVVDLGWNDAMSIALVQKGHSSLNIIEYLEDTHRPIDSYSAELKDKALHWGKVWLPHDGFSGNIQSGGKSVADIFKRMGWDVASKDEVVQLSVEDGIRNARMMFGQVAFNAAKCERLVECLKRYRRRINRQTNEEAAPLHDEYSHGADCFRYICCNADKMTNEERHRPIMVVGNHGALDAVVGY